MSIRGKWVRVRGKNQLFWSAGVARPRRSRSKTEREKGNAQHKRECVFYRILFYRQEENSCVPHTIHSRGECLLSPCEIQLHKSFSLALFCYIFLSIISARSASPTKYRLEREREKQLWHEQRGPQRRLSVTSSLSAAGQRGKQLLSCSARIRTPSCCCLLHTTDSKNKTTKKR